MFIAGVRKIDRIRGAGWADCPNCEEHTAQDVVDEMRFVGLFFYRFLPIHRRRVLACRRCGHRRPATSEALSVLNTAGHRINRAWLVPIGLAPFLVAGLITLVVAGRQQGGAADTISYTKQEGIPVAPITYEGPSTWSPDANSDVTPPVFTLTDPTQRMQVILERITDSANLTDLATKHYTDTSGINDEGVPDQPPSPTPGKVAGLDADRITFTYKSVGETAKQTIYFFFHGGVGYSLTFIAHGQGSFDIIDAVEKHVVSTFKFTEDETPPPCPTAAPGGTPPPCVTPGASASASPGASPSPSAKASATP